MTLLPVDPDASAGRIRAAVRDRLGVDLPVIVSDCFGRPWRWGIVDVAIGVAGIGPLEDLRGHGRRRRPDDELDRPGGGRRDRLGGRARPRQDRRPTGRRSSAAPGRPRAEASIRDALIPGECDLFR